MIKNNKINNYPLDENLGIAAQKCQSAKSLE
jgi:hypothetical protein